MAGEVPKNFFELLCEIGEGQITEPWLQLRLASKCYVPIETFGIGRRFVIAIFKITNCEG